MSHTTNLATRTENALRQVLQTGEPLDLLAWLSQVGTEGGRWVVLGKQARLPVQVVAFRLSEASEARARQRLRDDARKKGRQPTRERVALTAWLVLVTNVPVSLLSAQEVGVLAGGDFAWGVDEQFSYRYACRVGCGGVPTRA
jgi:hypothetical protein